MRRAAAAAAVLALAGCGGSAPPAGPDRDVSREAGPQAEARVVVDPSRPDVLLAASNDESAVTVRVYASTDGGRSWSSRPGPRFSGGGCASDPAPAIGPDGRQYLLFLRQRPCERGGQGGILAATRAGPGAAWSEARPVAPPSRGIDEDRPDAAVDTGASSPHRGRVYVAWIAFHAEFGDEVVLSSSDDGGRTWREPSRVSPVGGFPSEPAVAVASDGDVYAAWFDGGKDEVAVARSTDGGRRFEQPRDAGEALTVERHGCRRTWIPAQPKRCVGANPAMATDDSSGRFRGRIYLTYGGPAVNLSGDVFVSVFDALLRPVPGTGVGRRLGPPERRPSDQFLAQVAVDSSDGTLWACYYDTRGHPRRQAVYSCTASFDGGRTWAEPVAAASAPSDETRRGASPFEYGDFEGLAAAAGAAHPMWTDSRLLPSRGEEIFTRAIPERALR